MAATRRSAGLLPHAETRLAEPHAPSRPTGRGSFQETSPVHGLPALHHVLIRVSQLVSVCIRASTSPHRPPLGATMIGLLPHYGQEPCLAHSFHWGRHDE